MTLEEYKKFFRNAPERYTELLEKKYPRILKNILEKWESPQEQELYLSSLVVDLRGDRQGFPTEVMNELLFVSELYRRWRSERCRKADDSKLKFISADLVGEIENKHQKRLTPELVRLLMQIAIGCAKDDMNVFNLLSEHGISPNQKDADQKTPLMHAAFAGSEKLVLALIQAQANPHLQDISGNTALHWAVVKGRLRISEILLYFGADPDIKNKSGSSVLALASIRSDSTITQRLLDYGADMMSMDSELNTPLQKAVIAQALDCIWYLLISGSPRNIRNRSGLTADDLSEGVPAVHALFDRYRAHFLQGALSDRSC